MIQGGGPQEGSASGDTEFQGTRAWGQVPRELTGQVTTTEVTVAVGSWPELLLDVDQASRL